MPMGSIFFHLFRICVKLVNIENVLMTLNDPMTTHTPPPPPIKYHTFTTSDVEIIQQDRLLAHKFWYTNIT